LIENHRLALLGMLTGALAHEYNNLMTPALSFAHEALHSSDPQLMQRALERVVPQIRRAVDISRKLLDLAHAARHSARMIAVRDAVDDAVGCLIRPFERDGARLEVEIDPELRISADPLLFQQLILNLLLNARQATRHAAARVRITAEQDGDVVQIDVSDNGQGLKRADIQNRINPFLASDCRINPHDWQAVGMGLNVCRMIAQSHGATLEAVEHEGPGCTFRVRWPALTPAPFAAAAAN
jgi:signal transduction histidine kinase